MYKLKPGIKRDPVRRWALPDRIFFGHGACHILAGVFLKNAPLSGFFAERIIPSGELSGNHIYVTDGKFAFDYQGYSVRKRLLDHHERGWSSNYNGNWDHSIEVVNFDLLRTEELNARKMLGPDQYLHDPIPRAIRFIDRFDHERAVTRAALSA